METTLLRLLPEVSVGVGTLIVLVISAKLFFKYLSRRDDAFQSFVKERNHDQTNLIVESKNAICASTETIKEVGKNIEANTEVLKEVRNLLIKR